MRLFASLASLLLPSYARAQSDYWSRTKGNFFEGSILIDCHDIKLFYNEITSEIAKEGGRCFEDDGDTRSLYQFYSADRELQQDALMLNRLWPKRINDRAVVSYFFRPGDFDENSRELIREQLRIIEDQTGVITFAEEQDARNGYLLIQDTNGCASYVGRIPMQPQRFLLGSDCLEGGEIQQLFLHALGMWHEQSRPDRDQFVEVLYENIEEGKEDGFAIRDNSESLGSRYDYNSLMHYSAYEFSANGAPTIDSFGNPIGQREGMSESDIVQLRLMYQCSTGPREFFEYLSDTCSEECPCWEGATGCSIDEECQGDLVCDSRVCATVQPTKPPTPLTAPPTRRPLTRPPTASPVAPPTSLTAPPTRRPLTRPPTASPVAPPTPLTAPPTRRPLTRPPTPGPVAPPTPLTAPPTRRPLTRPPTPGPVAPPTPLTAPPTRRPLTRPPTAGPVAPPTPLTAPPTRRPLTRPPTAAPKRPPTPLTAPPTRRPLTRRPTAAPIMREPPTRRPTRATPEPTFFMSYRYL